MPNAPQQKPEETRAPAVNPSGIDLPPPAGRLVPPSEGGTHVIGAPEEFLSLHDILLMILRRRRSITLFVLLATLAAGVFFFTRPRQFKAEGYLQVIYPMSPEGRVDKELFETLIASHLQKVSSAYIARNVAGLLNKQGLAITPLELESRVNITRPIRTDLIRLVAGGLSAENALLIAQLWVREYLASIQQNNIYSALSQTRFLLKQAQSDLMEKQAMTDKMREQVALSSPVITLSRAVDDRQLWSDLTRTPAPDPEMLKKLSEIHIKGQEQSEEYINLMKIVLDAEQLSAAARTRRDLYQETVSILNAKISTNNSNLTVSTAPANTVRSEAEIYVNMMLKSSEIVQFGEPGLVSAQRGALMKTGIAFLMSLGLACFAAFMREWGKGLLSS